MTEILLDGVTESKRETALIEIQDILNALEVGPLIDKIIVTQHFRDTIRSLSEDPDYEPRHEYGAANAKVLPCRRNDGVVFTIVVNGETYGDWEDKKLWERTHTMYHEMIHVSDLHERASCVGLARFFSEPSNTKEILLGGAWNIWMEYHAERLIAELCAKASVEEQSLRAWFVLDALNCVLRLGELIDDLKKYLNENEERAERGELNHETACHLVNVRVTGILVIMAYLHPKLAFDDRLGAQLLELKKKQNFSLFLAEDYDSMVSILDELFVRNKGYDVELLEQLGSHIDSIDRKCGMTIYDKNGKLWVRLRRV